MSLTRVGILSPGDMGHTVGQVLGSHGLRVIACLQGRSERTRSLAEKAGIADVGTYDELVKQADMILSILVPAQAGQAAEMVAGAMAGTGAGPVYVDCNAISPQTTRQIAGVITQAGGRFVDASILGGPPKGDGKTRFYAAGPDAGEFEKLSRFGLNVIVLDDRIGQAAAMKMCYAGLTKGLTAMCTELLVAAEALGILEPLSREFEQSQSPLQRYIGWIPGMPEKSRRFVGEMEEIASTLEHVGLTPNMHLGAADVYRFVGGTDLADRTPEDPSPRPTLDEVISRLAASLQEHE
jgi:3-hydroxyisobutyrate dehydrogenase-like beta-hydroxyacid dehydrogenase